jgi:DNA-binding HxlR family transcriptional regulator
MDERSRQEVLPSLCQKVVDNLYQIWFQSGGMKIYMVTREKQCDFLYLQHETEMNKGTLSSHLSRLEVAEYVEVTKGYRGKIPQTLLRLTPRGREAFTQYRKRLKASLCCRALSRFDGNGLISQRLTPDPYGERNGCEPESLSCEVV